MKADAIDPQTQVIALATDATLGVAFGLMAATKPSEIPLGLLCAVHDELRRRGKMADVSAALGARLSQQLGLKVNVDRSRSRRGARQYRPEM